MTLAEALAVFGMGAVPDAETLTQLYRVKAKAAHPDAGGSDAAMAMLAEAMKVLEVAEPGSSGRVKCKRCGGSGHAGSGGFRPLTCAACGGTGWKTDRTAPVSNSVWLRDVDGTGSMHVCAKGDPGAVEYVPA